MNLMGAHFYDNVINIFIIAENKNCIPISLGIEINLKCSIKSQELQNI